MNMHVFSMSTFVVCQQEGGNRVPILFRCSGVGEGEGKVACTIEVLNDMI